MANRGPRRALIDLVSFPRIYIFPKKGPKLANTRFSPFVGHRKRDALSDLPREKMGTTSYWQTHLL